MIDDTKKAPLALFEDFDEVPATPPGKRDVAALDELAEAHGFRGGVEARSKRGEGRGSEPRATIAKKPPKPRKKENVEIRRIGRPRTGRTVPFSQTVHPGYANGLYDYCRRNGVTVTVALERSLRTLLKNELREARQSNNDGSAAVIEDALRGLPNEG